jgi:outer membrane biosynthesis protein TonB
MSVLDDDEEQDRKPWWIWVLGGLAVIGLVTVVIAVTRPAPPKPKLEQHVMHVALPPPPPPKKQPEPEPVKQEPQKMQENSKPSKVMENKPAAKSNPAPAGSPLTAAAGAGANAYGLAVGNGSGGGMIGGGGGGGGGGSRFGAYAGVIQSRIEAALHNDERTRSAQYLLKLSVWLSPTGQVLRVKVASTTGDPALDQAIERIIAAVGVGQAPPGDMPQPINLQVRARSG